MDEKRFSLRLSHELFEVIEKRAEKAHRSINNEIVVLIKVGLVSEEIEIDALEKAEELLAEWTAGSESRR